MLSASAANAHLRQRNRLAVGTSALVSNTNMGLLVKGYETTIRPAPPNSYTLDVPDTTVEQAWIADWEAAYDIAHQQARTYVSAVLAGGNPAWTAVTGYYAAFFAMRAFLYGVGVGNRGLPRAGILGGGLYSVTTGPGAGARTTEIRCRKVSGGGSHKAGWLALREVSHELLSVGGLDLRSTNVIDTYQQLIQSPQHVSAFRNNINYSLDIASAPVQAWASELTRLSSTASLETAISSNAAIRGEHRVELLMLGALSWTRDIYADYMGRAARPDRRRRQQRASTLALEAPAVASALAPWF